MIDIDTPTKTLHKIYQWNKLKIMSFVNIESNLLTKTMSVNKITSVKGTKYHEMGNIFRRRTLKTHNWMSELRFVGYYNNAARSPRT